MVALRVLFLAIVYFASLNKATPFNPEACVFNQIFSNYSLDVRPIRYTGDTVHMDFKFFFRSLGGINEREETLDTVGYIWLQWNDFQLQWDPDECNGTSQIKVPAMNVWLPEFILSNSVDQFHEYTYKRDFGVWVRHDGRVHWAYGGLFSTVCDMNMQEYPFDQQTCSIVIESWLYNDTEMTLHVLSADSDTQTTERDTQWSMVSMDASYNEVAPGWPAARVSFEWKRKVEYHIFNIICPTTFVLVVALGVFWLPADCGEKVSLSITVLLAFSVIQLVIMDIMPPSSENIPNISKLVLGVMILSTLSVLTSMWVVYINFKPARTPVPRFVRKILYSRLTWILGLKTELPFDNYQQIRFSNNNIETISNDSTGIKRITKDDMHVYDIISHLTRLGAKQEKEVPRGTDSSFRKQRKLEESKLSILQEILENIKTLVKHKEDEASDEDIITEWKTLAKVIDRIIFITCFLILIIFLSTF